MKIHEVVMSNTTPEMRAMLAILMDHEHPYQPVIAGWLLRMAFEGNGSFDGEKYVPEPFFAKLVEQQLETAREMAL